MTDPTLPSRRVLIADSHEDAAESLAELLAMHGHETRCAYTTPQLFAEFEAFQPDVVLISYSFPPLGGCELLRRLKSEFLSVPERRYLAMTGYSSPTVIDAIENAGFDGYIFKPADVETMLEFLR